jgi:hypothetical protein
MTPPRRKGGAGRVIVLLLVVVILVGGAGAAWYFFLGPGHSSSSSPFFDRHGLQSNVPLPNNVSFQLKKTISQTDAQTHVTITFDIWGWGVSGDNAVTVQQFYKDNLPKNGWTRVNLTNGDKGEKDVTACQGGQVLFVGASDKDITGTDETTKQTITITAPSGGSALGVELSSSPVLVQLLCSNSPILPTP